MNKFYTNTFPLINMYKKASNKSEIVSQMIYGENFKIIYNRNNWLKIKTKEDNYQGFITKKNFRPNIQSTHKVCKLKANVYSVLNKTKKINELPFGSKVKVTGRKSIYFIFEKGLIKSKDLKPLKYKEKNLFNKIKIFKNVKYKWGGKSFKGIDCSALVQVCLNFNNKFCPRDTSDQIKFFKKNIKLKNLKKNDLIYWKGHVALALSKKRLIHAYGPSKRTLIMITKQTIKRIYQTANLKVIGVKRV